MEGKGNLSKRLSKALGNPRQIGVCVCGVGGWVGEGLWKAQRKALGRRWQGPRQTPGLA